MADTTEVKSPMDIFTQGTDYSGTGNNGTVSGATEGPTPSGMTYSDQVLIPSRNGRRFMSGLTGGYSRRSRFKRLGPLVPRLGS